MTTRFDANVLELAWPDLAEPVPANKEFVCRDAGLAIVIDDDTLHSLSDLASSFQCSIAGLVLQVLFEFSYGHYLMTRMRREKDGLYKGFPSSDPAPWSSFDRGGDGRVWLAMPRRLHVDLDVMAQRENLDVEDLAGLILRRYAHGHLDRKAWPSAPENEKS